MVDCLAKPGQMVADVSGGHSGERAVMVAPGGGHANDGGVRGVAEGRGWG